MLLSSIEYNAVMVAIERYKDDLAQGDSGIDPFNNEEGYTTDMLIQAINDVENRLISDNCPR